MQSKYQLPRACRAQSTAIHCTQELYTYQLPRACRAQRHPAACAADEHGHAAVTLAAAAAATHTTTAATATAATATATAASASATPADATGASCCRLLTRQEVKITRARLGVALVDVHQTKVPITAHCQVRAVFSLLSEAEANTHRLAAVGRPGRAIAELLPLQLGGRAWRRGLVARARIPMTTHRATQMVDTAARETIDEMDVSSAEWSARFGRPGRKQKLCSPAVD